MLRRLSAEDLKALHAIEKASQPAPWSAEIFSTCLDTDGCQIWGYDQKGFLSGFVVVSLKPLGEAHLFNLCVEPSSRRSGIATMLLDHAISTAVGSGAGVMFLEVRRSNAAAIALYTQKGFVRIGERKNYYPGPDGLREDAITFAMELGVL